ncbi:relaxase/mobilization nuclease domain-containing protein [Hymenobacter antarcticus]|uniref:MobA/VirD2-like nuclease domain-containing protein n=1 Tax=Hymenobacter antarcticus TaxID=486270 RepID=A0ABP7QMJ0_9BACT
MIGKLYPDDSFDRLSAYVLQQDGKQAEVLAANGVRVSSAEEMAADFEFQRSTRPEITMAVEHVSLAWLPSETEKLTNEVMTQAAMLYMHKRDIDPEQTQWVLARHFDEDHPHCHLLLNRVTNNGGVVPNNLNQVDSAVACRKVEAEMGFADAAKIGTANKLAQAEKDGEPKEKLDRLHLKAVLVQALEKHLPAVTTVAELQEALAKDGVRLQPTFQEGKLRGVVFTADAYPGLHMTGTEAGAQYRGGQLRKTLEEQASKAQAQQEERAAQEAREAQLRKAAHEIQQTQQLEAQMNAQFREVLLAALSKQLSGAMNITELQTGLATEGVTARSSWQADGQLQEISFTAAAFPGRELSGAALGPEYEAATLSQTLTDQATQRASEQREAEQRAAQELREFIRTQQQQVSKLEDDEKQAVSQGDYGLVAEIRYGTLVEATTQLTAYQEQAQATAAGREVLNELAVEDKKRADLRQQLQDDGKKALLHPLQGGRGNWRSWTDYKEQVHQLGFDILEIQGQMPKLQHTTSGEMLDLTLVQPGGEKATGLRNQVNEEIQAQENARLIAEDMFKYRLVLRNFTSLSELDKQMPEQGYRSVVQPDGTRCVQEKASGRQFRLTELHPDGQPLEAQLAAAITIRQQELQRGQLVVSSGPGGSAAERADYFQRVLEAAGAQVLAGAGPVGAGKVVLEYRYEWDGAKLETVNQALRQVQSAPDVLVREQSKGFDQPEAAWPVRTGEYGLAVLVVLASDKDKVETVTRKLEENGGWVNVKRSNPDGTIELDMGYKTQHPDFPALNAMLDRWASTTSLKVQETVYGGNVREEVRQAVAESTSKIDKALVPPAPASISIDDYEID